MTIGNQYELIIGGMTCAHCAETVERALGGVPGVAEAHVLDRTSGKATAVADPEVSATALESAVRAAGYTARVVEHPRLQKAANEEQPGEGEFDLMVIGAGSAGFAAAIKGAELGYRVALVALTSIAIAFAIAGLTPNPQTATNVGGTLSFLLFALTGAMLPVEALPGVLPEIVPYAVPHTSLIHAIRGIALTGEGITAYGQQVLVGAVWLAIALIVAAVSYRFTEE